MEGFDDMVTAELILLCNPPPDRIVRQMSISCADNWVEIVKDVAKSPSLGHPEWLVGLDDPPDKLLLKHVFVELFFEAIAKLEVCHRCVICLEENISSIVLFLPCRSTDLPL